MVHWNCLLIVYYSYNLDCPWQIHGDYQELCSLVNKHLFLLQDFCSCNAVSLAVSWRCSVISDALFEAVVGCYQWPAPCFVIHNIAYVVPMISGVVIPVVSYNIFCGSITISFLIFTQRQKDIIGNFSRFSLDNWEAKLSNNIGTKEEADSINMFTESCSCTLFLAKLGLTLQKLCCFFQNLFLIIVDFYFPFYFFVFVKRYWYKSRSRYY